MLDDGFFSDSSGGRSPSGGRSFLLPPTIAVRRKLLTARETAEAEEYRPIAEIVEELYGLGDEAKVVDKDLKNILKKIGY